LDWNYCIDERKKGDEDNKQGNGRGVRHLREESRYRLSMKMEDTTPLKWGRGLYARTKHEQYFTNISIQKYKGFLCGPLIVQTLSAHFTAIRGSIKVKSMGDPKGKDKHPTGALGLAAAAVCCNIVVHVCY
jgi:hypothetical protein